MYTSFRQGVVKYHLLDGGLSGCILGKKTVFLPTQRVVTTRMRNRVRTNREGVMTDANILRRKLVL